MPRTTSNLYLIDLIRRQQLAMASALVRRLPFVSHRHRRPHVGQKRDQPLHRLDPAAILTFVEILVCLISNGLSLNANKFRLNMTLRPRGPLSMSTSLISYPLSTKAKSPSFVAKGEEVVLTSTLRCEHEVACNSKHFGSWYP